MPSSISLSLVDGVRVVVPDSLNLITPYVLLEQHDWFEDEIVFLRRLLQPGQKVIDIGANYGVYTLSMAKAVGPVGCVWAFEPAAATAALLAQSIDANRFANVVLDRSAVSCVAGSAQLSTNTHSELNAVLHGPPGTAVSETVSLVTLDGCLDRYGWSDIEFVKIDAEGEEANILKGASRFLSELSPLVQYEIKAGTELHLELIRDFAAHGYDSYRLVPGLDLLVPFHAASADPYLLNLFCCKVDRAARLAARGALLVAAAAPGGDSSETLAFEPADRGAYGWRRTLAGLPYAAPLADVWERTIGAGGSGEVERALALYAASKDSARQSGERRAALEKSFTLLTRVCEREPSYLRLASLARVARDYGARAAAVAALQRLANSIMQLRRVDPTEPFLAPGQRFDGLPPGPLVGNWILAAALEEWERLGSFSSFYTGESARGRLETIAALGFASPEMERRLHLLRRRFGVAAA